jgi:ribosome-associated toxin RatA of RatAB toxin-antitoxin module
MTRRIEKSIVVNVPVDTAYAHWTQYEDFPHFMEGVQEVRQVDDRRLHWVAEIGNKTKEWDAEIVAENENEVISWRSTSGTTNNGTVRFRSVSPTEAEVNVVMEYEPETAMENMASWFGVVSARVEGDLQRFKEHVESKPEGAMGGMPPRGEEGGLHRTGLGGTTGVGTPGLGGGLGGRTADLGAGRPGGGPGGSPNRREGIAGIGGEAGGTLGTKRHDPGVAQTSGIGSSRVTSGKGETGMGGARESANKRSYSERERV